MLVGKSAKGEQDVTQVVQQYANRIGSFFFINDVFHQVRTSVTEATAAAMTSAFFWKVSDFGSIRVGI